MRLIHRQSGFSLLEVMLAVTVAIALGGLHLTQIRQEVEDLQAKAVGQQLQTVGKALDTYIAMQYSQITAGTNVTGVGTASDPGPRTCTAVSGGHMCRITTDTLRGRGLLPQSFSGQNAYGAEYDYFIRVQGPAPDWRVTGVVRTTTPFVVGGVVRYDLIGTAMYTAGADSGAVRANANTINGLNGTWTERPTDPLPIPAGQLGQLAYRVGYGTSGFAAYVRLDGTVPMSGSLNLGGNNIVNANNIQATGDVNAGRLATTAPRSDAIILGASNASQRTTMGNSGNRLEIRNAGGVRMVDSANNGTALLAGDINIGSLTSSSTGVFAGALQANGLTTTGGANIASAGQISAIGDFTTTNGSFRTTNGSFVTNNGNISAVNGTVTAGSLVITGNATIGNNLTFHTNGAGWFYQAGSNTMTLGNNANLRVPGQVRAGSVHTNGLVEVGTFLRLGSAAVGSGCTASTFAVSGTGRLLQCVSGTYREAGGVNNVVTVNAGTAANAGGTSIATCGTGYRMVSGGYIIEQRNSYNDPTAPGQSFGDPSTNSWRVVNPSDGNTATFRAQAVCVN